VGPTASGKTELALELAERGGAEILSLDSMLVYRGMTIGTAKPSEAELARVPHRLIDLVEPQEAFDVQRWLAAARAELVRILDAGGRALFVGGTGFYLAALLRGLFEGPPVDPAVRARLEERARQEGGGALYDELLRRDPDQARRFHPNDLRRVLRALEVLEQTGRPLSDWQREWDSGPRERERRARLVGLEVDPATLDRRIAERAGAMLDAGWREEALAIRAAGGFSRSAVQALGYAEVLAWADGELEREQARERIALRTRQFSRRQRTWYRKFAIRWVPYDAPDRVERALEALDWS